jgi:hypothetical protein
MNELRALRRAASLSQPDFAERIGVPLNTFRMWDSAPRRAPGMLIAHDTPWSATADSMKCSRCASSPLRPVSACERFKHQPEPAVSTFSSPRDQCSADLCDGRPGRPSRSSNVGTTDGMPAKKRVPHR